MSLFKKNKIKWKQLDFFPQPLYDEATLLFFFLASLLTQHTCMVFNYVLFISVPTIYSKESCELCCIIGQ